MFPKEKVADILKRYDKNNLSIATVCSHSSLQIFDGAKREGFKTIGIALNKQPKFYDAFPKGKPDEFFIVQNYEEILSLAEELRKKNTIIIPHGSFVEYLGPKNFEELELPIFGNRQVIEWESDRTKQRQWLLSAGLKMPAEIKNPKEINRPVMVKYYGAKGGRGFFIAKDYKEFKEISPKQKYIIQEYIIGTRYYIHYFYSPIKNEGYKLSKGTLELLGMDRRDESNIDELYKVGAREKLKKSGIYPTFVVTGNVPVVIRESLLPKAFEMGENVVEESLKLFGGIIGPFCLETVVTDQLEYRVFEISARIVAGTNISISGSPYSDLVEDDLSTGRRIAIEIKNANKMNKLSEIVS
ncbi:MAG: formate--phosphoribosylaminoimidazolecarboxamide ligase [Thermoplasmata archaeon]